MASVVTVTLPDQPPLTLYADRRAGHGGILWSASIVLADAVTRPGDGLLCTLRAGARVLELGAGLGLPGVALARARPDVNVVLTDAAPALVTLLAANAASMPNACACTLAFGQALRRLPAPARPPFDAAIVSDVLGVGDAGAYPALIKTLRDLGAGGTACVFMSYKPRAAWEARFFDLCAAEGWRVTTRRRVPPDAVRRLCDAAMAGCTDAVRAQCCESVGEADDAEGVLVLEVALRADTPRGSGAPHGRGHGGE